MGSFFETETDPVSSSSMKDVLERYRHGQLAAVEALKVFDVSQIVDAFRHFSSRIGLGKVAVSLENSNFRVKARFKTIGAFCTMLKSERSFLSSTRQNSRLIRLISMLDV